MQGNLITTVLALLFYLTSGIFGGSGQAQPITNPNYTGQKTNFPMYGMVSGQQANIRNSTTNGSGIIATATKGSRLLILDEKNNYYQVQTDNGQTGWVAKWLLSVNKSYSVTGSSGKTVAAYYVENYTNDPVSLQALTRSLGTVNTVIPFSFSVDQNGTIKSSHNPKPLSLSRSSGAKVLALINNIKGGNFNSNTVHRLLTSSVARSRAVNGISRMLIEKGYQGVNIDFENVPARDRLYLTAFFRELAAALHPLGLTVTASVPAKTYDDRSSSHSGAFDYKGLAPYLDQVMIMTYDEHYSGGNAGPVASYPWVEKVIRYSLNYFPGYKLVVGIAAYGYDWSWGSGKALHYKAVQNLINSKKIMPKWNSYYKVPYFTYKSWGLKHEVWYEDARSTAAKLQLVKQYGLKGIAVWRLGYEDPGIWSVIRQAL